MKKIGEEILSSLCSAGAIPWPEDTSELIGASIPDFAWRKISEGTQPAQITSRERGAFVYVVVADAPSPICKIGVASSPEARLKSLSTGSPYALRIEHTTFFDSPHSAEAAAHSHFSDRRLNGEWFAIEPADAVKFINEISSARTSI